jgi:hypothetical protein
MSRFIDISESVEIRLSDRGAEIQLNPCHPERLNHGRGAARERLSSTRSSLHA